MCTVTWRRDGAGYSLLMNRDELSSRGEADPPRRLERSGVAFLAPIDSDSGGTWIAANAAGVVVCLLNRYPWSEPGRQPPPEHATRLKSHPRTSRGHLVMRCAGSLTAAAVGDELGGADLAFFAPFTMLAVDLDAGPWVYRWDGFGVDTDGASPPVTSSSFDGEAVVATRQATYDQMIGHEPDLHALRAYHRSHRPYRGPYSVCAHRDDGGSRSLCEVHVGDAEVTMSYRPGPPCESGPTYTASLRRLQSE